MLKKFCSVLLTVVILFILSIQVFAAPKSIIYDAATRESKSQFLVNITKPENDEFAFKKSYVLCGNTDKENIQVELLMFNDASGKYEPYENTDGVSKWSVGSSGIFMKEIALKDGANRIRIVAYRKSDEGNLTLDSTLQVSDFVITVKAAAKDKGTSGLINIQEAFDKILGK